MPLSSMRNLGIEFPGRDETDYAAGDVSLALEPGEILDLGGKIDCGKSASASMAAGLQSCATNAYLSRWTDQFFR